MTVSDASNVSDVSDLLNRVHRLELVARHNAAGLRPGDYLTAIRGRGMVFHECRKYVPGEPARSIDWNITARFGEPYVKVHLEERRREVFIALDVSPSMSFGSRKKTKLELGVELAASIAATVEQSGDHLAHVLFADRVLAESRPAGGGKQLFRVLRSILEHVEPWSRPVDMSDIRVAIHAIQKYRGRFVVFLISDFIDHDIPEDLKYFQAQHDVSLLHVYDPLEYGADVPLVKRGQPSEGPRQAERIALGALGASSSLSEMQGFLREKCGTYRLAFESFATDERVRAGLDRFFHRKRRLSI